MKPKLPITLMDAPAVVRLKREFAGLDDRDQVLREWIDLHHGDVEGHYAEREIIRQQKIKLSDQITQYQHRESGHLAVGHWETASQ